MSYHDTAPAVPARRFFVAIGLWCLLLAIVGFMPNMSRQWAGELSYPSLVHVHAIVMLAWLVVFTVQASLMAGRKFQQHRTLGWVATVLAAFVWISMTVTTVEALLRYSPETYGFLIQPLLIQLGTMVVFPIFVTVAILVRRQPEWHKRLMMFATFSLVQAAFDRMHWLPNEGLPMFWHAGLRMYVLLVLPVIVFDLLTLRRIHPATLSASAILVTLHAIVTAYWDDTGWAHSARAFWMWLRASNTG